MKFWLKLLLLVVIGVPVVAVALANKQMVPISADPTGNADKMLTVSLPLFVVVFASLLVGMLIGGIITWVGQGKHRRAARRAKSEAANLRAQMAQPGQSAGPATGNAVMTTPLSPA